MVGLENFELAGIKSYTRFWGLLMFGSYSVINVIVLLNLLIAMMSNSYAMIDEQSDTEWKFARTRLWMSYFEQSATLPPPFNILPTPKMLMKMLGLRKKDKVKTMAENNSSEKENDARYTAVMRALVWRYVSAMHRKMDDEPVTEDDVNELKGEVSALRYELLEVFEKNGMDVSFTDRKEKAVLGKKMKVWERRLMKDFHVAPVALEEDKPEDEDGLARFRRIAKLAVASKNSVNALWDRTLANAGVSSQIGRCRSRESFKNQQNLQRAMDEARKLVMRSPLPDASRGASPIDLPVTTTGHMLMELLNDISTDVGGGPIDLSIPSPKSPWKPPGEQPSTSGGLLSAEIRASKTASPNMPSSPVSAKFQQSAPTTPAPSRGPSSAGARGTPRPLSPISSTGEEAHFPAPTTPAPSRGPSPAGARGTPRPLSPISSTGEDAHVPEPSPLKAKRVPGETSPPKVIKRKQAGSTAPSSPIDEQVTEAELKIPSEVIAVARPVAPEIKPAEGAIPPPPVIVKPKVPSMEVKSSSPSPPAAVKKSPAPSRPSSPKPASPTPEPEVVIKPPTPPRSNSVPSKSGSPVPPDASPKPRTPSPMDTSVSSHLSSSKEQLIPPSPTTLRPGKKIEDVNTIKRQPKTGWL